MSIRRRIRGIGRVLRFAFLAFFLFFLLFDHFSPIHAERPYSPIVLSAEGTPMMAYLSSDDKWRLCIEEEEMTENLRKAFLLKEDRYFYYHPGFNPVSLVRAGIQNMTGGQRVSGASTITMQLVRLLEPRERTYLSKLVEIIRAMQLEWHYSKDEILRHYLNMVPYGGNTEGVKSASFLYFQCLPAQLSPAQIATLSVVPNRPSSWKLRPNNGALLQARNRWLHYYASRNWINEETLLLALQEPLAIERKEWQVCAPHLCRRLVNTHGEPVIRTHIRYTVQQKSEALVRQHIERLKSLRITNAAVVIIDNRTGKVISYIGSADFNDKGSQGEVDGVKALRSPGSALKPFVYAMAIEKGLLTPELTLYDVPVNIGGYTPENYDLKYSGAVSARNALARSLNIPAVKLLQEVGKGDFFQKMGQAGMAQLKKDGPHLGLSAILGGCGVRLEELTQAYYCLANYGHYSSLRYVATDSGLLGFQWIKPEAAYLVNNILTGLSRPDFPQDWQLGKSVPRIAWKTGTSYGRRDAWSIGFNDAFTVGVWVGNFNNEGVPALNGADIATPLLFQLFDALEDKGKAHWLIPPKGIFLREVCTETGQIPGEHCLNKRSDYFLPGISRHIPCACRREFAVDEKETMVYCNSCMPSGGFHHKAYRVYTPEHLRYFEEQKIHYEALPPHNPLCTRVFQEEGPRIISPTDKAEYLIEKEEESKLALTAEVEAGVKVVYWYMNDRYLGPAKAGESFFCLVPAGDVKISCTDDKGRTSHVSVKVKKF